MTGSMQNMLGIGKVVSGAASVSISPSTIATQLSNGASYSSTATATPSGITSPTYLWSWLSGGSGFTLTNTTTATVGISSAAATNTIRTGELQCTVSGTGGPATASISVEVAWGVPL